jgi:hypothetical protein
MCGSHTRALASPKIKVVGTIKKNLLDSGSVPSQNMTIAEKAQMSIKSQNRRNEIFSVILFNTLDERKRLHKTRTLQVRYRLSIFLQNI